MSFIKFPTQIKPSRVTMRLERSDEIFMSPATGIQQVASRGNAYWRMTYEFKDISLSEREVVEAFLMKCKGSLNTFKVTDPANYEIRGSISYWVDMYNGAGRDLITAGSDSAAINSDWNRSSNMAHHVNDDNTVQFEWRNWSGNSVFIWRRRADLVSSLETGKAYINRVKFWQNPEYAAAGATIRAGSGSGTYLYQSGPSLPVRSSDCISVPWVTGNNVSSTTLDVINWALSGGTVGQYWHHADFTTARCVLISNSENLLTRSNDFAHADWNQSNTNVESGWADKSPTGVTSGAWKLYENSSVNTLHQKFYNYTKINTEDLFTASLYARAGELDNLEFRLGFGSDITSAIFYLSSGTHGAVTDTGVNARGFAEIYDVGSEWYRCQITGLVSSNNLLTWTIRMCDAGTTDTAYTGNGSDGLYIFGAQLRQFPFMGQYVPTVATAIVGTAWQTGSKVFVDGLNPGDKLQAGTRFEIVNRFHNVTNNLYERSEFKRLTENVVAHREGWAILPFDPPIRNAPFTDRSYRQQSHLGETMHNPVIFADPEIKARLLGNTIQYIEKPLQLTDVTFDVIEDLSE